jgi:SAM-dependent methyltransferase
MAAAYAADNDVGAYNAHYERPATIALLGSVEGLDVLELGCGAGPLTAWLVEHGATVTGVDVSPAMVELARERLGGRARLLVADIADPLTFAPDESVDLVVASLVLHYLEDWVPVLREVRRVLRPGGAVVCSTHHPTMDRGHTPDDYFAVAQVTETWEKGGRGHEVTFWRRPLTAMADAIATAGFLIERLVEPQPAAGLRALDPDTFRSLSTEPQFLFFRLVPRPEGT